MSGLKVHSAQWAASCCTPSAGEAGAGGNWSGGVLGGRAETCALGVAMQRKLGD